MGYIIICVAIAIAGFVFYILVDTGDGVVKSIFLGLLMFVVVWFILSIAAAGLVSDCLEKKNSSVEEFELDYANIGNESYYLKADDDSYIYYLDGEQKYKSRTSAYIKVYDIANPKMEIITYEPKNSFWSAGFPKWMILDYTYVFHVPQNGIKYEY